MDQPPDFTDIEQLRIAALEDLASAGQLIFSVREMVKEAEYANDFPEKPFQKIVCGLCPGWRSDRLTSAISEAAAQVLRAMDCLSGKNDSPTTDALVEDLIDRWSKAGARDREAIVSKLREAFTKNGQPK